MAECVRVHILGNMMPHGSFKGNSSLTVLSLEVQWRVNHRVNVLLKDTKAVRCLQLLNPHYQVEGSSPYCLHLLSAHISLDYGLRLLHRFLLYCDLSLQCPIISQL